MNKQVNGAVIKWSVPYVSGLAHEDIARMIEACKGSIVGRATAQLYFSHLIRTGQWHDVKIWRSSVTGLEYNSEDEIPTTEREVVSVAPKWVTQHEFIRWCGRNVPGFKRSTFLSRNASIDTLTEIGMKFEEAVWIVAGLQNVSTPLLIARTALEYDKVNEVVGPGDSSVILNLPLSEETREEIRQTGDASSYLDEIKGAVLEVIREESGKIERGQSTPTLSAIDIRRDLLEQPTIRIIPGEPYGLHIEWPKESGKQFEDYDIFLVNRATGERLTKLPDVVRVWFNRRIGSPS